MNESADEAMLANLRKYAADEEPWRIVGAGLQVRCVVCGSWCDANAQIQDYVLGSEPGRSTIDVQAVVNLCAHDHECPSAMDMLGQLGEAEGTL